MTPPANILGWIGAVSPFVLLFMGAYFKRRLDRATEGKTYAETEVQYATARRTVHEADSIVLSNAKLLIEQAKQQQAEKDQMAAERLAVAQTRIRTVEGRMSRVEEHLTRLRAALATHGVWDASALVEARVNRPDFPSPPPFPPAYPPRHADDTFGLERLDITADDYFAAAPQRRLPHIPGDGTVN